MVVDKTGVGAPVFDLLRQKGLQPVAVHITPGNTVKKVNAYQYNVPKIDLIQGLQVLMQQRRLKLLEGLPLRDILIGELYAMEAKETSPGHESFNAREGSHDDMVLSLAIGAWYLEHRYDNMKIMVPGCYDVD